MGKHYPRIIIGAQGSGQGKTLITCGLLLAFQKLQKRVAAFKCGPDYIDPMFHEKVLHTKSKNLDTYFTDKALTRALFAEDAEHADLSVIEGVMGYYDGIAGISTDASTYDMAQTLETPAVLIVNGAAGSVSVCAVIKGFLEYRRPSGIAGVILNQVSAGMYEKLKNLIEEELLIPVCGYLPKLSGMTLESRHLGLRLPDEQKNLDFQLERVAEQCLKTIQMDKLIAIGETAPDFEDGEEKKAAVIQKFSNLTIGVAEDEAFCFYYKDNLQLLRKLGARLVSFSPLWDEKLPEGIDGLLLGGGYPELYADTLNQNKSMRKSVQHALRSQIPCIAECGGFLYLKEKLTVQDGQTYEMAGVIKGGSYFTGKLSRFGYLSLKAQETQMLCDPGMQIKGHEFHYMDTTENGTSFLAEKPKSTRTWECGHSSKTLYAGFPHLYLYSNIEAAENFLHAMKERKYDTGTNERKNPAT